MDNRIQLPAIKGIIGDWVYYQTVMPFKEIVTRIDNDHSIREYKSLDDHLQRDLSKRSKGICEYLVREDSRFFNSVIIGLFGGNPNWYNFSFSPSAIPNMELSEHVLNTVGILELTGGEKLFSIDGQHRIDGIKQALKNDAGKFPFDELAMIIVAHDDTNKGKIRTRRLFSEINTKALKVSGLDDLITNEDNPILINVRRLYAEFDPFRKDEYIALKSTVNVPAEAREFTSILTLKSVNEILYEDKFKFLGTRPQDSIIEDLYNTTLDFWTYAVSFIEQYKSVLVDQNSIVSEYRNREDGGSMLFRPVGIGLLAEGYVSWLAEKGNVESFWEEFNKIDDSMNGPYWKGILWDNATKKVISGGTSKFRKEYMKYLLGLSHDHDYVQLEYTKLKGGEVELQLVKLPDRP